MMPYIEAGFGVFKYIYRHELNLIGKDLDDLAWQVLGHTHKGGGGHSTNYNIRYKTYAKIAMIFSSVTFI